MKTAKERARLKDLFALNILDTPREERFDRHTRLVSQIFDVPAAFISLIDRDRQWIKSAAGSDLRQTTREESICACALDEGFLEIPDTLEDDFFRDHPAVKKAPYLRFYAGSVIYGTHGQPIGTLCLNDYVPRELTPKERAWLKAFTDLVQEEIHRDLALENDRARIQEATLRDPTTGLPGDIMLIDTLDTLINVMERDSQNLAVMQDHTYRYDHDEDQISTRHHLIEDRLESALLEDWLTLTYQPIFAADGSRIVSFEALARWDDDKLGRVSPGEFIPIAEKSRRLSFLLTYWVLRTACKEANAWRVDGEQEPLRVAVNIPAREFYSPGFVDTILDILQDTELEPNRLILELTEESLMQDMDQTTTIMAELSQRGIKLALDDFGTGYSSLSILRRLPVDTLKIDKSVIDGVPGQHGAVELVSGVIAIARGMGLSLVAEGVEYESQRALLEQLHCDMIQGFLLGRPVSGDKIPGILKAATAQLEVSH